MNKIASFLPLALVAFTQPIFAEVLQSGEGGFSVAHSVEIDADSVMVYRTMTRHIDQWWNGAHSWSADASNLYIDAEVGGCFCEKLPNGGKVEHLRIIYLSPGKEIRFDGSLGPLQLMAVNGRMIWTIEPTEAGSKISFTYHVHGFVDGGFNQLAPAVDGVIGEQLSRLASFSAGED